MRLRFATPDLQRLFEDPSWKGHKYGRDLVRAYRKKVGFLVNAGDERDLWNYRALRFEKLHGDRAGQHSIRLNDQWRLILWLETDDEGRILVVVEIVDYH